MGTLSGFNIIVMFISTMLSTCFRISYHFVYNFYYFKTILSKFNCYFFLYLFYSGNLEVTVEFLIEIDKLVQLIESPIFACKHIFFYVYN